MCLVLCVDCVFHKREPITESHICKHPVIAPMTCHPIHGKIQKQVYCSIGNATCDCRYYQEERRNNFMRFVNKVLKSIYLFFFERR